MPPSLSSDPVFAGIFILTVGILFLIRENLELRKRLRKHVNDSNEAIRDNHVLISEMEVEILRLSGIIISERETERSESGDLVSREAWACAVLGLDPDKGPFLAEQIVAARKRAIMRAHPDQGGAGRIDHVEMAAQALSEGCKAPA